MTTGIWTATSDNDPDLSAWIREHCPRLYVAANRAQEREARRPGPLFGGRERDAKGTEVRA